MKQYFKWLLTSKEDLLTLSFLHLSIGLMCFEIFENWEDIIEYNAIIVVIIVVLVMLMTYCGLWYWSYDNYIKQK